MVPVVINKLLEYRKDTMTMMGNHTCPYICGIIEYYPYPTKHMQSVTREINELFNMDNDEVTKVNIERHYY